MRKLVSLVCFAVMAVDYTFAADASRSLDLRRAVPNDAYLAAHGWHNPERDYQREHFKRVWETVRETRLVERVSEIATSRVPESNLEKAKSVWQEVRDAAAPFDLEKISECKEVIYAQVMQVPAAQHLVLLRLTPDVAKSCEQGFKNMFGLVEQYAAGAVTVETQKEGTTDIITLVLPPEAPFQPAVARVDDVLLVSTSREVLQQSLAMLLGKSGSSKFDDPRLKEALSRLPKPEDSLVFYDGKLQFEQLRRLGPFIREKSGGNPKAEQAVGLLELVLDEVSILDYEVTVEYTEDNRNCSAAFGKLVSGAENKLLMKIFGSGQPFENWTRWVPANATAYSLSTGVNLHPLYERVVALLQERSPEAAKALEQFEALQEQFDVHLDRDLLQAFSGECVSVTFPADMPTPMHPADSVFALRCSKPERIRELLHRLVERLQQIPPLQAQQIQLTKCEKLEGFEELSTAMFVAFGIRPAIGFRDGWMIIGSSAAAVEHVLATKAGQGKTIADADSFAQLRLKIEGPVASLSYTNIAENLRGVAVLLNQVGAFLPAVIAMAGPQADPEAVKAAQEVFSLLPSVAKIVASFDFLEARLSVTQEGEQPNSYVRRAVTRIKRPSAN